MQKKLLVSLLVSLALSVPAGYAVYLLTDSDFLSPGILRLMQALAVLLLIFIWGEFALLARDSRRSAHRLHPGRAFLPKKTPCTNRDFSALMFFA